MATNDAVDRVQRIYSSIGFVEEADINKIIPQVINNNSREGFYQDWSGGLTDSDLANLANSLIQNIASLEYHLKKWADHNDYDKEKVDTTFSASQPLKIIHDLWNNDKHGYPPRQPSRSGLCPQLAEIKRLLRLETKAEKGSFTGVIFTREGVPKKLGSGTTKVVVTGDILDRNGNKVGDFYKTALEAVEALEALLTNYDVKS